MSRRQWPFLLGLSLLVSAQVALGVLTMRLGLSQPGVTVAHQLVAALLVALLAALVARRPQTSASPLPVVLDDTPWSLVMASSVSVPASPTREEVVPSRKRVKLPPGSRWPSLD